jgi:hypothetical protein
MGPPAASVQPRAIGGAPRQRGERSVLYLALVAASGANNQSWLKQDVSLWQRHALDLTDQHLDHFAGNNSATGRSS